MVEVPLIAAILSIGVGVLLLIMAWNAFFELRSRIAKIEDAVERLENIIFR